jgi:hypothetical protein
VQERLLKFLEKFLPDGHENQNYMHAVTPTGRGDAEARSENDQAFSASSRLRGPSP